MGKFRCELPGAPRSSYLPCQHSPATIRQKRATWQSGSRCAKPCDGWNARPISCGPAPIGGRVLQSSRREVSVVSKAGKSKIGPLRSFRIALMKAEVRRYRWKPSSIPSDGKLAVLAKGWAGSLGSSTSCINNHECQGGFASWKIVLRASSIENQKDQYATGKPGSPTPAKFSR